MRAQITFLFLVFTCILLAKDVSGQQIQKGIKFKHIRENPRLSNLNIRTIFQDSKSFLWVGTDDGLNKFDGYDFKIYRTIENDTASLVKNTIQSIFEDSRGTLWVSTLNSGLHYYNRTADVFYRVPEFSEQHCQVLCIVEDQTHNLWIGGILNSQAFVATLNHQTHAWSKFMLFPATEGITSILHYTENEFWLGARLKGLYKWNKKTGSLDSFQHDPKNPNSLPGDDIVEIVKDSQGNLWIGTHDGGLCKFNIEKNIYKNFSSQSGRVNTEIPSNIIRDIYLDGSSLWMAIENGGLSRINTETESITNFLYAKGDPNSIINNSIWSLHRDQQGRIWVGSYAKGLCVLDALEDKISVANFSLENDLVNAIYKDSKNRMWIGTEDGLILQDKSGMHHFRLEPNNNNSISSNAINCIYEDSKDRIWIGFWNGGVNRFNENTKSFIRYQYDPNRTGSLTSPHVYSITESLKTGELLVSTFGGLNILKDEKSGFFENIFEYPYEGDQLLFTLLIDRNQNIWVGSNSGLSQYSLGVKKIKHINILGDTTKVSDQVNCIFEDHNGKLWVGSNGGLHQMIGPSKFITYTTKDGLPVNIVQGILEDPKGNLWLGTTNGLTVFNPQAKTFKTYDESDGLLSNELRRKAFFKAKNGQMFVGGKGINSFFPDSIISNPNKPSVYITDLKIFNQSVSPKSNNEILKDNIAETKEIYLDRTHNFFSLHYVGINFTASYKNQYAYKLEGFTDDWVNVGTQRFATFTNLDPGTYTFRVKASNNDGLWNEEGASLIIHVLPPWWKTWWFRMLSAVLVGVSAFAFYRHRIKTIANHNKKLSGLVIEKTKELQEKNKALTEQEEEIRAQNKILISQGEELATQNEELLQSREEISAQRDLVSKHNQSLEYEVEKRTHELVEYNHQLEQYAFISAHNLRAPVARILGLGQLLNLSGTTAEDKEQIYPKLVNTTKELDSVVKDLNIILELKKNNDSFITDVDLNAELEMLKENLESEIIISKASIISNFSQVRIIRTVKPYLDSILHNLLSNAIKYRHPNRVPEIHIQSKKEETEVCIIISDNGLGMELNLVQDKLFNLYSRFHTHVEGKGMGLYLVKTQLTAMGGRIEVDSQPNKGSIFRAYFRS